VGCGNSSELIKTKLTLLVLPIDMFNEGYKHIINIDYSKTVIDFMEEKYGKLDEKEFKCISCIIFIKFLVFWMNVQAMKDFKSGEFDIVLDKGCLDSVLVKIAEFS